MKNDKLILKYEIYIAAPPDKVWKALTDGSQTKEYFYVHDRFAGETATYQQSADGWNVILSSLKTYLETGKPLNLNQAA